ARQTNNKYNRTYAGVAATPYQRQFVKYNQQTTKQFRQEQDDSFNCKQQTQHLNTRQTSKPQNTDPELGENVRIMYKAITMLHHLNNTTKGRKHTCHTHTHTHTHTRTRSRTRT